LSSSMRSERTRATICRTTAAANVRAATIDRAVHHALTIALRKRPRLCTLTLRVFFHGTHACNLNPQSGSLNRKVLVDETLYRGVGPPA
jgi:hypothetical protein